MFGIQPLTMQIVVVATAALTGGIIATINYQLKHRRTHQHERILHKRERRSEMEENEVARIKEQRKKAEAEADQEKQKTMRVQNEAQREKRKLEREKYHAEQTEPTWVSDGDSQMTRPVDGAPVTTPRGTTTSQLGDSETIE